MTDFRSHKFGALFDLLDFDGDGYITPTDFDSMGDNVGGLVGADTAAIREWLQRGWAVLAPMDTDRSGRIERAEFVAALADRAVAEQVFAAVGPPVVDLLLCGLNVTGDRKLSADEYRRVLAAGGVAEEVAAEGFRRLDRDGDGAISADEFHQAVRELYLSDDPQAPGNSLFGAPPKPD